MTPGNASAFQIAYDSADSVADTFAVASTVDNRRAADNQARGWLRRANVWRKLAKPARGTKRLRSVKRALLVHRPYYGPPVGFGIRIGYSALGLF
jgi:hypothetical protein